MFFRLLCMLLCSAVRCLNGPNVCWDNIVNKVYCCSEYEEINETCVACNTGFTSIDGKPCKPCKLGLFGKHCISLCKCSESERCHHINGCVINVDHFPNTTVDDSVYVTKQPLNSSGPSLKLESFGNVYLYSITTAGLLFAVGICTFFNIYRRKFEFHMSSKQTDLSENRLDIGEQCNPYEHEYHTIDESKMVENIDASQKISHQQSIDVENIRIEDLDGDRSSYLYPYSSLLKHDVRCQDNVSSGDTTEQAKHIQKEYLTRHQTADPYHGYTTLTTVEVHNLESTSSESSNEFEVIDLK